MLNDEFIKSEMLAEEYIESIIQLRKELEQGKIEECLRLLNGLEIAMQTTLAIGDLHDLGQWQQSKTLN